MYIKKLKDKNVRAHKMRCNMGNIQTGSDIRVHKMRWNMRNVQTGNNVRSHNMRWKKFKKKISAKIQRLTCAFWQKFNLAKLKSESGQGTTEYAILVGVLVVIAILAIMIFRPKLEELWNAISEGINGL